MSSVIPAIKVLENAKVLFPNGKHYYGIALGQRKKGQLSVPWEYSYTSSLLYLYYQQKSRSLRTFLYYQMTIFMQIPCVGKRISVDR